MEGRRWLNTSQPQTLQNAVILLYINAAFGLLFGGFLSLVLLLGVVAGFGIANEARWGYGLGVAVAVVPLAARLLVLGPIDALTTDVIGLMFEVLLMVLLLHPQSREYQRIWFK
jgi:hypothetical protein